MQHVNIRNILFPAEYLKRQFLGDNPSVPMVKNGLDCAEAHNHKLIKAVSVSICYSDFHDVEIAEVF